MLELLPPVLLWLLKNLFLAVIPVGLAYGAVALGQRLGTRSPQWLWPSLAPLLFLWLIFLPNSCYLFTEPIHLLRAVAKHDLWPQARHDRDAALMLGYWTVVSMIYLAAGFLTFALSIRPLQAWGSRAGLWVTTWAPPFFLLMALGVYLGRIVRYNSWDLLTRPGHVIGTVAGLLDRPVLLAGIALFAVFLWLAYLAADIWLDGADLRWRRWRRLAPSA